MGEDEIDEMTARRQVEADADYAEQVIRDAVKEKDEEIAELKAKIEATRELLRKYLGHVAICDFEAFLADPNRTTSAEHHERARVVFSDEEWAELQALAVEGRKGW